jgi:hypothetical protein
MRKDARNPSKSQAEIHKVTTVEPFGIVYAAVLVGHISISLHPLIESTDPARPLLDPVGFKRSPLRLPDLYRSATESFQGYREPMGPKPS